MSVLKLRTVFWTVLLVIFCATLAPKGNSPTLAQGGGGMNYDPCDAGNTPLFPGFSPDGKYIYTYSQFRGNGPNQPDSYYVQETQTGKPITSVYTVASPFAISPNNAYFALTNLENFFQIDIIDSETGKTISNVKQEGRGIRELLFSPDNKRLLVIELEQSRLWNVKTGKLIHTFPGLAYSLFDLSVDGSLLLISTPTNPEIAVLWNVNNGQSIVTFERLDTAHSGASGASGAISPDNKLVVVTGNSVVDIWNTEIRSDKQVNFTSDKGNQHKELHIESISPDHHYGAFITIIEHPGDSPKFIAVTFSAELWDLDQQKSVWDLSELETETRHIFFPDRNHLLVISTQGFHVWDLKTHSLQATASFSLDDGTPVWSDNQAVMSPDGRYLLISAMYKREDSSPTYVTLWNIATGQKIRTICG